MSELVISNLSAPPLHAVEASFRKGIHVVLGTEHDGSAMLVGIAAGLVKPRRGKVLVAGQDPRRSPAVRRRIACLLAEEELPPAATVQQAVERAAGWQGFDAARVLGDAGLEAWRNRSPASLSWGERRSVALALALGLPEPHAVVLHEPLAGTPGIARGWILERLAERAAGGVCVLATSSSARDATELGGSMTLLEGGRLTRRPPHPAHTQLAPGTPPDFLVRTDQPRELCKALVGHAAVTGIDWDEGSEPGELRARGTDTEALSLAILAAARAQGISISALAPTLPRLELVRAASAGLARAAYERAYQTALGHAQRRAGALAPAPASAAPPLPAPPSAAPAPPGPPAPLAPPGSDDAPTGGKP